MCGLDANAFAVGCLGDDRIHPLASDRVDVGRFAEDHCQHVVAGGRFRQVDIGFQADAFEIADLFGGHHVVQVFGDRVGVETHAGAEDLRSAQPQAANGVARAVDEVLRKFAGLDFLGELLLINGVENVVQVSKERAECEAHDTEPNGSIAWRCRKTYCP